MVMNMEERDTLLIMDKSFEAIMEEALEELQSTPISNGGPGGVARLLLAIVNRHVADFYKALGVKHAQAALSKATKGSIDALGFMLNCTRRPGELDDDYKFRITQQTLVLEAANETAVRLAALSVPGVEDVINRPYTFGTGSFSIYPVTNDPYDSRLDEIIAEMQEKVDQVRGHGIRAVIMKPRLAYVELKGRLKFGQAITELDMNLIQDRVTTAVRSYVNTRKPGDTIRISEIRRIVFDTSDVVSEVELFHFSIDGRARLMTDQESAWNTRFIEADRINSIQFI